MATWGRHAWRHARQTGGYLQSPFGGIRPSTGPTELGARRHTRHANGGKAGRGQTHSSPSAVRRVDKAAPAGATGLRRGHLAKRPGASRGVVVGGALAVGGPSLVVCRGIPALHGLSEVDALGHRAVRQEALARVHLHQLQQPAGEGAAGDAVSDAW